MWQRAGLSLVTAEQAHAHAPRICGLLGGLVRGHTPPAIIATLEHRQRRRSFAFDGEARHVATFVVGAFFGALLIDRKFFLAERYHVLDSTLRSVSDGFLAPIFFAYLGLEFNIFGVSSVLFVVVVLIVSIVSKMIAGWLGGRTIGMSKTDSMGIAIILNGRGVMELVIASIGYERGLIGQELFSTLVLMGVVSTLITPVLFRKFVMPRLEKENEPQPVLADG